MRIFLYSQIVLLFMTIALVGPSFVDSTNPWQCFLLSRRDVPCQRLQILLTGVLKIREDFYMSVVISVFLEDSVRSVQVMPWLNVARRIHERAEIVWLFFSGKIVWLLMIFFHEILASIRRLSHSSTETSYDF